MSSTKTCSFNQLSDIISSESPTPSNSLNTKLAEQFSKYDDDDGRSSRTYQNVNDEECFNQLHQELCSRLNTISSDKDALLNEQLLNILQGVQLPSNENDLLTLKTKLQ